MISLRALALVTPLILAGSAPFCTSAIAGCLPEERTQPLDGAKDDSEGCNKAPTGDDVRALPVDRTKPFLPEDHSNPGADTVFTDQQDGQNFCEVAYANAIKGCPQGNAGANCRADASKREKLCLGKQGGGGSAGSESANPQPITTTSAATCRRVFQQQMAACRRHTPKLMQMGTDATGTSKSCLAEAVQQRDQCLAISKN